MSLTTGGSHWATVWDSPSQFYTFNALPSASTLSKASSFVCLAIDAVYWLVIPLGLSALPPTNGLSHGACLAFLTVWWLSSKNKYPKRSRWKPYCLL